MKGLATSAILWVISLGVVTTQSQSAFPGTLDQHPAIDYRGGAVNDPATLLQREIAAGTTSLVFDVQQGFLR